MPRWGRFLPHWCVSEFHDSAARSCWRMRSFWHPVWEKRRKSGNLPGRFQGTEPPLESVWHRHPSHIISPLSGQLCGGCQPDLGSLLCMMIVSTTFILQEPLVACLFPFHFCKHHCTLSFAVDCVDIIVDITKIPNICANASPCIANICNRHSQGEVFKSW